MSLPLKKILLVTLTATVVSLSGLSLAKDKKDKPVPPPTKQTQVIRAETYKGMEVAQKAYEAKDYAGALAALEPLRNRQDKLNDYERATLYNLYAAVYYAQDNVPKAIEAYTTVLKQPNLPDGLRDGSLYAMAQLYFITEDYPKAIAVVKKWLSVVAQPSPEGYALLAQAYYQTQKYAEAEKALVTSLRISKERGQAAKESALALLRAIYYERKDYVRAAKVLELLVTQYPGKAAYWQQLAGMKGLLDQQREQLTTLHAAYRAKLLSSEGDLLNLARLYMVQEAPYAAVRLITQGLKDKRVKPTSSNLELFAQALAMSREYEKQVPVLKKLAEISGSSKHYVYLGQAYTELGQWPEAATAFRAALRQPGSDAGANVQMQLGTVLFNADRYAEARQAFSAAGQSPSLAATAVNWIKFVDQEIARREAVGVN
ncbi:MAG TPA: tetratricopeptide repeat protein [Solimonas sp.]|nr:tetratricopeptide repeat protein [Solimonas sp.]